jgi:DNA-binding CsgD family transcriptional regulator
MLTRSADVALENCYKALPDDAAFAMALEELAQAFGARGCSFVRSKIGASRLHVPASPLYRAFLKDFVAEGWASSDLRALRGWPKLKGGRLTLLEHDVTTEDERDTLPVYRDLYRRHDLYWWATVSFPVGDECWALSFLRSRNAVPFDRSEAKLLGRLRPDLSRLVGLRQALQVSQSRSIVEALDSLGRAAFIVANGPTVLAINEVARECLDGLIWLREGRLIARDQTGREVLAQLRLLLNEGENFNNRSVVVRNPQLMRPIIFDLVRLDTVLGERPCVLVTVRSTERQQRIEQHRLKQAFDFSPAELSLATWLGNGATLDQAAFHIGIGRETARTQLKALFAKTGCRRQADLVILLLQAGGRAS